jgi:hypothetical protein
VISWFQNLLSAANASCVLFYINATCRALRSHLLKLVPRTHLYRYIVVETSYSSSKGMMDQGGSFMRLAKFIVGRVATTFHTTLFCESKHHLWRDTPQWSMN